LQEDVTELCTLKNEEKLLAEYQTKVSYPDKHDIFNALHYTSYKNTKVVIIGQDSYHGQG
jgi:uracil-DNA glycosylase